MSPTMRRVRRTIHNSKNASNSSVSVMTMERCGTRLQYPNHGAVKSKTDVSHSKHGQRNASPSNEIPERRPSGARDAGPLNERSPVPSLRQRQTKGVAVMVNCNGPRLTFTTLIKYVPLCVTGAFSTATPFTASTVWSVTPDGFTSINL